MRGRAGVPPLPSAAALLLWLLLDASGCDAFVLEGSTRSFVRFPKWQHAFENELSFDFRTRSADALLLYTDDGGRFGDFLELAIVGGRLQLRFRTGRGARDAAVLLMGFEDVRVDDGFERSVDFVHSFGNVKLQLDRVVDRQRLQQKTYAFGDFASNRDVFVGGLPEDVAMGRLSSPLSGALPHLAGSVRNLMYATFPHGMTAPHSIDAVGRRDSDDDYCHERAVCANGGACYSTNDGPRCNCVHTDFDGPRCEDERAAAKAAFHGSEFVGYDFEEGGYGLASRDENLTLEFRTRRPNGLLFYSGDGEDYLHVSLRKGVVLAESSIGGASRHLSAVPLWTAGDGGDDDDDAAALSFADERWHRVRLQRSLDRMWLSVDGAHYDTRQAVGTRLTLNNVFAFVGGAPANRLPFQQEPTNFRGCLKRVRYRADGRYVDLLELAKARGGSTPLVRLNGSLSFSCSAGGKPEPVSFATSDSYIAAFSWTASKKGSIGFHLRTNEPDGLILYNAAPTRHPATGGEADFFAFELLNGRLYFALNLGSGAIRTQVSAVRLDDGALWHEVTLVRDGLRGYVVVDAERTDFATDGSSDQLDLGDGALYVAGFRWHELKAVAEAPPQVWSISLRKGFVGCLKDVRLDGVAVDLADFMEQSSSAAATMGCYDGLPRCQSSPCERGGKCAEGWHRYVCDCAPTERVGRRCELEAPRVAFGGGGEQLRVALGSLLRSEAEDVEVRLRTHQPDGFILGTSCRHTFDRLQLQLVDGRLQLDVHLGGAKSKLDWGRGLNDGRWHTVRFSRRRHKFTLFVDGISQSASDVQSKKTVLEYDSLWAGRPDGVSWTRSFKGELAAFSFNGMDVFHMAANHTGVRFNNASTMAAELSIDLWPRERQVTFETRSSFARLKNVSPMDAQTRGGGLLAHVQVRTLARDGLLLLARGRSRDFFVVELTDGRVRYAFNAGDGLHELLSPPAPLDDFRWHSIAVVQRGHLHQLIVDKSTTSLAVEGGGRRELNVRGDLLVGGERKSEYGSLDGVIRSRVGFRGCLASLQLGSSAIDLLNDADYTVGIGAKCQEPAELCSAASCHNGGACEQRWRGVRCDCAMTSLTGDRCTDDSVGFRFDKAGGVIEFSFAPSERPSTTRDRLAVGLRTAAASGTLVRVDSTPLGGASKDFISLHLVDGFVQAVYNVGTEEHTVDEPSARVDDGLYHAIRFVRVEANASLQLDALPVRYHNVSGPSPALAQSRRQRRGAAADGQLSVFNSQSRLLIGGELASSADAAWRRRRRSATVGRPFVGVLAGVQLNDVRPLDLFVDGDGRMRSYGRVRLSNSPRHQLTPPDDDRMMSMSPDKSTTAAIGDDLITAEAETELCLTADSFDEDCFGGEIDSAALLTPSMVRVSDEEYRRTTRPSTSTADDVDGSGDLTDDSPPPSTAPTRPPTTTTTTTATEAAWSTPPPPPTTRRRTRPAATAVTAGTPRRDETPARVPRTTIISIVSIAVIVLVIVVVFLVFKCYKSGRQSDGYSLDSAAKSYAPLLTAAAPDAFGSPPSAPDRPLLLNGSAVRGAPRRRDFKEWYV